MWWNLDCRKTAWEFQSSKIDFLESEKNELLCKTSFLNVKVPVLNVFMVFLSKIYFYSLTNSKWWYSNIDIIESLTATLSTRKDMPNALKLLQKAFFKGRYESATQNIELKILNKVSATTVSTLRCISQCDTLPCVIAKSARISVAFLYAPKLKINVRLLRLFHLDDILIFLSEPVVWLLNLNHWNDVTILLHYPIDSVLDPKYSTRWEIGKIISWENYLLMTHKLWVMQGDLRFGV